MATDASNSDAADTVSAARKAMLSDRIMRSVRVFETRAKHMPKIPEGLPMQERRLRFLSQRIAFVEEQLPHDHGMSLRKIAHEVLDMTCDADKLKDPAARKILLRE